MTGGWCQWHCFNQRIIQWTIFCPSRWACGGCGHQLSKEGGRWDLDVDMEPLENTTNGIFQRDIRGIWCDKPTIDGEKIHDFSEFRGQNNGIWGSMDDLGCILDGI